jgi:hypothetical protein
MEALKSAGDIELYGVSQVVPYLKSQCGPKVAVYPICDEFSQRIRGDFIFYSLTTERAQAVDVKSEQKATPHLFIETQSDMHGDPCRGWLHDLHPDTTLAYFVIDTRKLYTVRMRNLRKWMYEQVQYADGSFGPRLNRFREVPQSKRQQRNVTVGRLVPVGEFLAIPGALEHEVPEVTSGW